MKIGLDIGGSHIAIGLVNDNYDLILKEEKDIKISESENPELTLKNSMIALIDGVISKFGKDNVELIGLACPRKYKQRKNCKSWKFEYTKYGYSKYIRE